VCHGERGEKEWRLEFYSHYRHTKRRREFVANPINQLDYKQFRRGILKRNRFMPIYRFTEKEIEAIYFYIQEANKKREENSSQ